MLRRFSTKIGISKDKSGGANASNANNANALTNGTNHETNGATNGVTNGAGVDRPKPEKRSTMFSQKSKKEMVNHSASRADVERSFSQFAQIIHASLRPLPTQSGDGVYLENAEPSGLLADIKVHCPPILSNPQLCRLQRTKSTTEVLTSMYLTIEKLNLRSNHLNEAY